MFQGDSEVGLTATNAATTPGLSDALELERLQLEDDASDLEIWPILSFALTVRL